MSAQAADFQTGSAMRSSGFTLVLGTLALAGLVAVIAARPSPSNTEPLGRTPVTEAFFRTPTTLFEEARRLAQAGDWAKLADYIIFDPPLGPLSQERADATQALVPTGAPVLLATNKTFHTLQATDDPAVFVLIARAPETGQRHNHLGDLTATGAPEADSLLVHHAPRGYRILLKRGTATPGEAAFSPPSEGED
ncbi:MAG: hypothetical protein AAGF19_07670 [Pseudomonadota bacterium]